MDEAGDKVVGSTDLVAAPPGNLLEPTANGLHQHAPECSLCMRSVRGLAFPTQQSVFIEEVGGS